MPDFFEQLIDTLIAELPNVLIAILIFVVSLYLASLVSNLLRGVLTKRNADREVTILLAQVTRWTIVAIGIIGALQRFFDVTTFLAGLGIIGIAVGFAMQEIVQNFVAGVILLVQQPFEVEDVIETDQYTGTIQAINLRTTEMKALDGRIVIIPNAKILANPIINYTRAELRRVELTVGVSYDADPAKTRQTVMDAVQNVPGFVGEPKPMVVFHNFGGSSVDLSAYFWINMTASNPMLAKDAAIELVKAALDKQGIEIPLPITTVIRT